MSTAEAPPAVSEESILEALRVVHDPDLHRDIVALGFVKNLRICGGNVAFDLELTTPACPVKDRLRDESVAAVKTLPGVQDVTVTLSAQVRKAPTPPTEGGLKAVKNTIAVASGKGGVGKSTVATNLAIALARTGAKVGLMDADVYGPSVPMMLGKIERPEVVDQNGWIRPIERFGVKFISMGLLTSRETPVIWRGPMATKLVQQFLGQVEWGELDYLLIDLPPGTGDVQLTLTQSAPLTGAVIVTTPQDVAIGITLRGLRMFEQVHVPILGIVENMSGYVCPHCNQESHVFHQGGGRQAADELGFPFLGAIPLDVAIAQAGDHGEPVVADGNLAQGSRSAKAIVEIAGKLAQRVSVVNDATSSVKFRPAEVRSAEGILEVRWTDGHVSRLPHRTLRLACPCAECVDEWTGKKRLQDERVPADVKALEVRGVGRYALQFIWTDGHSTGIYTYDSLRKLDATATQTPPPALKKLPLVQGAPPQRAGGHGHGHDHGHGHHHH